MYPPSKGSYLPGAHGSHTTVPFLVGIPCAVAKAMTAQLPFVEQPHALYCPRGQEVQLGIEHQVAHTGLAQLCGRSGLLGSASHCGPTVGSGVGLAVTVVVTTAAVSGATAMVEAMAVTLTAAMSAKLPELFTTLSCVMSVVAS